MGNQSTLDKILEDKEGILWDIDAKDNPIIRYKFILDEQTGLNVMTRLVEHFEQLPDYEPMRLRMRVQGRNLYIVLNHNLSAYLVMPSSPESEKKINGVTKKPSFSEVVLVINALQHNPRDYNKPLEDLMDAFYNIYRNLKTPSKT